MKSVIPLVIATSVFSTFTFKAVSDFTSCAGDSKKATTIIADLPSDPYDPPVDRGNPHGGNPHGGDPHDENHDPNLPSNSKEIGRQNPDPYSPNPNYP